MPHHRLRLVSQAPAALARAVGEIHVLAVIGRKNGIEAAQLEECVPPKGAKPADQQERPAPELEVAPRLPEAAAEPPDLAAGREHLLGQVKGAKRDPEQAGIREPGWQ